MALEQFVRGCDAVGVRCGDDVVDRGLDDPHRVRNLVQRIDVHGCRNDPHRVRNLVQRTDVWSLRWLGNGHFY